jgi:hypothetical protein
MTVLSRARVALFWLSRVPTIRVPPTIGRELLPLALPFFMFPWLVLAMRNYAAAAFFRDANMFTYAGFCLRKGQRMYVDFATPDGPLVYVIQAILQTVWGTSTRDLRIADLDVETTAGAIIGALAVPRARDFLHGWARRMTWAVVGGFAWLAQMLSFDNAATFQRENYYVAIGCVAIALVYASAQFGKRSARLMIGVGAFLSALEMFGKHSGVIYVGLVFATAWLVRSPSLTRRTRVITALSGAAIGTFAMLSFIALDGSLRAFWFFYFRYNLTVYRYVYIVPIDDLLNAADRREYALTAALALLGVVALRTRAVPAAIAAFAVGPFLHFAAAVAQMRGWRYHFIPVQASAHAAFVVFMAVAWCSRPGERGGAGRNVVAIVTVVFFGWRIATTMLSASFLDKGQKLEATADENDPHKAGDYLNIHTRSTDRVFYYGGDPLPLYDAQRLPATPYFVAWLVDFRAALREQGENGSLTVTGEKRDAILALQTLVRDDDCRQLLAAKPPALVFMDMSNMSAPGDPRQAVESWCTPLHDVIEREYHEATTIGRHHIFLRNDRD